MKKAGVTGYTGFIGKRLMSYDKLGFEPIPVILRGVRPEDYDFKGLDVIIHLAGKAHDMTNPDPRLYFDINTELTKGLVTAAKKQGVSQFIYFSSVKVYGENGEYHDENTDCNPDDAYGQSKFLAEQFLLSNASDKFNIAIIRPPLVYGPEVKGNMNSLMRLASLPFPLPFKSINNKRSMVYVGNLIELLNVIIVREAKGIFIAGDNYSLSTGQLVSLIRRKMGRKPGLVRLPSLFEAVLKRFKPLLYKRLYKSFVIDNSGTNKRLEFVPPYSSEDGIAEMVQWYKEWTVKNRNQP